MGVDTGAGDDPVATGVVSRVVFGLSPAHPEVAVGIDVVALGKAVRDVVFAELIRIDLPVAVGIAPHVALTDGAFGGFPNRILAPCPFGALAGGVSVEQRAGDGDLGARRKPEVSDVLPIHVGADQEALAVDDAVVGRSERHVEAWVVGVTERVEGDGRELPAPARGLGVVHFVAYRFRVQFGSVAARGEVADMQEETSRLMGQRRGGEALGEG